MNRQELEEACPWLRVPEHVDQEQILKEFKQSMPRLGWPCRVLGQESFLRGDALALKRYLLLSAPHGDDGHRVYRPAGSAEVLLSVSTEGENTHFRLTGAPSEGPFWRGDYSEIRTNEPGVRIRQTRVGDRFLTKLAARTDGQGFESESETSYQPHPTAEDRLIQITDVRNLTPEQSRQVRRAVVGQTEDGTCREFGPLGEEFETPIVSRRSPVAVGQYYSILHCFPDLCCEEYITVETFEEVTVPAGTFETFRLKQQSPLPDRISWFAPALNATVKETVNCEGYTSMEVLHEYRLE